MQNYFGILFPRSVKQSTDTNWGNKSRIQIHTSDDTGPGLIPPLFREEILEQNVIKDTLGDEVGSQMIIYRDRKAELAGERDSRRKKTVPTILFFMPNTTLLF